MREKWKYSDIKFDADKYNDTILRFAPWSGHRNFGYDMIQYYEPDVLVELGSHYGCSAFTFMQAIKDNHLDTKIYTVDLWKAADVYTKHSYEQDIYSFFTTIMQNEFKQINSVIMKTDFDNACLQFENGTIDILHIDGSHEYKDVSHDFELWLPKVKSTGILLFHDISEQKILGNTMGSCKLWKEIKQKHQWTVELKYSWGLGILFLSKDRYADFLQKVDLNYYLKLNTYEETICKDKIRKDYFKLEDANKWIDSLKKDKDILEKDNKRLNQEIQNIKYDYGQDIDGKNDYIDQLENEKRKIKKENDVIQEKYKDTIYKKNSYIDELKNTIELYKAENQKIIKDYEQTIHKKDFYIQDLENMIESDKKSMNEKISVIDELQNAVQDYRNEINKIKNDYENTITGKDSYIQELESRLSQL